MKYYFRIKLDKNPIKVLVYDQYNQLLERRVIKQNSFCLDINSQSKFYYLIVVYNKYLQLFSVFSRSDKNVILNEQTMVASIFSFSQLLTRRGRSIRLKTSSGQIKIAYGMRNNFISAQGQISKVISHSPNGLETNSYPLFNFLSNLIYQSIRNSVILDKFLFLTDSPNLLIGLLTLARHPFTKVKRIYRLISRTRQIYQPSLPDLNLPPGKSPIPNQWTLTLKFNQTGARNFIPGGPGNLVFDKYDQVWINNNVRQGTPDSSRFVTILKSNGQPSSESPLFGGGLLGAGFGAAINRQKDEIAIGNFGWGPTQYNPQTGSVTVISSNQKRSHKSHQIEENLHFSRGKRKTCSKGLTSRNLDQVKCRTSNYNLTELKNKIMRVQGLTYDDDDNLWMTSWGSQDPLGGGSQDTIFNFPSTNSAVVVYPKGDQKRAIRYEFSNSHHQPFDVVADKKNIYLTNSGSIEHHVNSSVHKFRLIGRQIVMLAEWESDQVEVLRQVAVNSNGEVYVAAVKTNRLIKFDSNLNMIKHFTLNINGPWGFTFDRKGSIYVANFLRDTIRANEQTLDMRGPFGITLIKNDDPETAKILTLPTGGKEVTLANGQPLYGNLGLKSFQPLMRQTACQIDRAGNLWVINNWKPALTVDIESNPGGDGVVVFLGLASAKI